jgi:hypothetical protein
VLVAQALWGVVALRQGVLWPFFVGKAPGLAQLYPRRRRAVDTARLEAVLLGNRARHVAGVCTSASANIGGAIFCSRPPWRLFDEFRTPGNFGSENIAAGFDEA